MSNDFELELEIKKHYTMGLCSITGQDYIPYLNEDIASWLDNNMDKEQYHFKSKSPYRSGKDYLNIIFDNETDLVAFKLR